MFPSGPVPTLASPVWPLSRRRRLAQPCLRGAGSAHRVTFGATLLLWRQRAAVCRAIIVIPRIAGHVIAGIAGTGQFTCSTAEG